jgi:hypothetical protein
MLDIQDIMDVTFNELSTEQQLHLKEAIEQFQQKCLMSFSKNRSGVPFLKSEMPRVRVCLVHVYGPNQAHRVQQPRVWLPASTLEPGSRAAIPPPPPPASRATPKSPVSLEPGSRTASEGDGA